MTEADPIQQRWRITRSQLARKTAYFESSSRKLLSGTGSPPPGPSAGGSTRTSPQWNRNPIRSLLDRLWSSLMLNLFHGFVWMRSPEV